jgi:hypothetical protein
MARIREVTRRVLSRRTSVADIIETALWLAIPYLIVGLVSAFFHVEEVHHLEGLLRNQLPAGGEMAAYLIVAGLWPAYLVAPLVCVG